MYKENDQYGNQFKLDLCDNYKVAVETTEHLFLECQIALNSWVEMVKNLREFLDINAQICPELENLKGEGMGSKKGIHVRDE